MGDCSEANEVWEHGENIYPEFVYKYCKRSKKGGGATRFKQHLVGRGNNVKHCSCIPPDVRDYFWRGLDWTADPKKTKNKETLLREEVATEGNVVHDIDYDDEELQHALHASREEAQHERAARQREANMRMAVVRLNNKGVACLKGSRGQARSGRKPLKHKQV
jgi:hypothetical protein